jgi:hypothetical protein
MTYFYHCFRRAALAAQHAVLAAPRQFTFHLSPFLRSDNGFSAQKNANDLTKQGYGVKSWAVVAEDG